MPMTFGMAMRSLTSVQRRTPPPARGAPGGGGKWGGVRRPPMHHRYWPVLTIFSTPRCFSFVSPMSGLTYTMRSPFLPAIFAQSSGFVVFGRSSFSLNSSRTAVSRSPLLLAAADVALERELLGAAHDGLDHRARGEVLEVQDLLVAVGVRDLEEAVALAQRVHGLDGGHDHRVDRRRHVAAAGLGLGDRDVRRQVLPEDVRRRRAVGPLDLDLDVEPARPEDRRVDQVLAVRGADHDDVLEPLDAVDLREQLRDDRGLDVGRDPRAPRAEQRVHLVEEHDDRHVLGGLFLGLHEDLADLALGLADVLVQQLRALDVEEEALDLLAARLRDLLGEVVRDGLGDHRLAAAGRAVEQHALRRRELVLPVVLGVEVRQLDGVLDRLDLLAEAADIVVADVRHLLEREVLDLALGQLLEQVARLRVHQDVVAGLQAQRPERVGDDADLLLVGAQRDDRALLVELLLQDHDVALDLVARRLDDVQPLVQDQLLAGPERLGLDGRVEVDLHLAPLRQDVDGAVLVDREVDAVRRGRRAELVDLLLEGGDLLPRLVEGVDELLVLVERLHELAVGLAQLVLEDHEVLRRVLELLPEVDGLRLERADVGLEVLHLDLVLGQAAARAGVGHGRGEELGEPLAAGATLLVELLHSPSLLT